MKKIILSIVFLWFANAAISQNAVASPEQIAQFLKTTTCVVLDGDMFSPYDTYIKEAIKSSWKITPYEFIDMDGFNARRKDAKYSFLIRTKVVFEKDEDKIPYSFISLVNGGKTGSVTDMVTLCDFPLSYYNVDYEKYTYKLGAIAMFVQNHVTITKNNPDLNEKSIIKYYNKNTQSIKNKTLYVLKNELDNDVDSPEKIKDIYTGKVMFVTVDDIVKAIKDKDPNVVFLHKMGPPANAESKERCYKIILGAADAQLYYFDFHKVKGKKSDGMLKDDFKNLAK